MLLLRHEDIGADALGYPCGRGPHRLAGQVRIAGGGVDLAMTKQLANHRQALTERQRPGGERVPKVMQPHAVETGLPANAVPGVVEVPQVSSPLLAGNHPGVARDTGKRREHLGRGRRQRDDAWPGLAVGQRELARGEVHVRPPQPENLVPSAPGQG